VFLRFESKDDSRLLNALRFLDIFEGSLPVALYYEDTKKYDPRPGVDWNPSLARELARLLGEGNVVANV
jgi:hypothetical protein